MLSTASSEKDFIQKLTKAVDAHLDDEHFGVSELAAELGMSRVTLHRKVKEIVKKSVSTFIRETRLKRAFEMLQYKEDTAAEIAYKVGFGSPTYFNKCFHDFYGFTPGDVLKGNHKSLEAVETKKKKRRIHPIIYAIMVFFLLCIAIILFNKKILTKEVTIVIIPDTVVYHNTENIKNRFLNGFSDALLADLMAMSKVNVISPHYVQRHLKDKGPDEIARIFNANYSVELTEDNFGEHSTIALTFSEAKTGIVVSSTSFDTDLNNIDEISWETTLLIAEKLNREVTPGELQQMKNIPGNLIAHRHYQKGLAHLNLKRITGSPMLMFEAIDEFEKAVQLDSTYGNAWLKLAKHHIGSAKTYPNLGMSDFFDLKKYNDNLLWVKSCLDKASDNGVSDNDEALIVQAAYCEEIQDLDNTIKFRKKIWKSSRDELDRFNYENSFNGTHWDYYNLKKKLKWLELLPDSELIAPNYYTLFGLLGYRTGFTEYGFKLIDINRRQRNDTTIYGLGYFAVICGIKDLNVLKMKLLDMYHRNIETTMCVNFLMNINLLLRDYGQAVEFLHQRDSITRNSPKKPNIYMAWLYDYIGNKEESNWHFTEILKNNIAISDSVIVPFRFEGYVYNQLAATYAFQGNKEQAYFWLKKMLDIASVHADLITNLEYLPHYDNIRNEPDFIDIFNKIIEKHQKEHDLIEELLHNKMDHVLTRLERFTN
jgi:AraC-like DNA-binding protein/tetratricopeptide (TPR) repeat protein